MSIAARLAVLAPFLVIAGATGALYAGPFALPSRMAAGVSIAAMLVGLVLLSVTRDRARGVPGERWLEAGAVTLVVLYATSLWHRPHFHLTGRPLSIAAPFFVALGWLVARWVLAAPARRAGAVLVVAQIVLAVGFFDFTRGALPTRDDHPAFLYRFHLLLENFPRLVFYSPDWNAGYLAYEIPATGALGPFLLAAPLFVLLGAERTFAVLIPYLFVGLVPWIFYGAMRALGRTPAAAALGGLLALAPTSAVFLYELRYGVYPFLLSSLFALVAASLFARLFLDRRGGGASLAALVAATSLCALWPLGAPMLAPVVAVAVVAMPRFRTSDWARIAIAIGGLAVLNLPWITDLVRYSDSAQFVTEQKSPLLVSGFSLDAAAIALRRVVEELHPVVLVFGIAGLAFTRRSDSGSFLTRLLLVVLVVWNLAIAAVGVQLKEQVALERFTVPTAYFGAALATLAIERLLESTASWRRIAVLAIVLGVSFLSVMAAIRHFQNRTPYRYEVLSPALERTLGVIRERCPREQRVLVPGFSLHWFGGGHIAALPLLADRSFLGNDYYHRRNYNDVVPPTYRSGERLGEYLELYDVGCILNWNAKWRRELDRTPGLRLLDTEGDLAVFATDVVPDRFLDGTGRVLEHSAGIVVESDDAEVVIKHRFVPGLETDAPAAIEPVPVADGSSFIRVRMGGAKRVEIRL